ncbi:hypothetical protein BOX15_Mlig004105g1, partial [Macrostomum lignano]
CRYCLLIFFSLTFCFILPLETEGGMLKANFYILLLIFTGCNSDLALLGNVSNSNWCTDVMNPTMDYLLGSSFLRSAIRNESIATDTFSAMGITISNMQLSGVERLERYGNLYTIVRSGQFLIVQGAIRAVEVSTSFMAKFSFFSPDAIQLVTRGAVIQFGLQVRLQTGERAALMSLEVTDLGRVEVAGSGRLSSIIRKATGNSLTRSRISKAIGSVLRLTITEKLQQNPLL